jgi:hypothetical protein
MHNDPLVDCDTCEIICFGTDYGNLTISGKRMSGTVESEDCETGEFDTVRVNLTRSSSTSSIQTFGERKSLKDHRYFAPNDTDYFRVTAWDGINRETVSEVRALTVNKFGVTGSPCLFPDGRI